MKRTNQNLSPLYPFLQEKPSQNLRDEDAFMQEHGGASARAVYLIVEGISAVLNAVLTKPIDLMLRAIGYESPLKTPIEDARSKIALPNRSKGARQSPLASKNSPNAQTCKHPPSSSKRCA